jgi:hypothetical protein
MSSDDNRSEWFVELVSGASQKTFPSNVISEFTTQLAFPLMLRGQWKAALVRCTYHKNWINIEDKSEVTFYMNIAKWKRNTQYYLSFDPDNEWKLDIGAAVSTFLHAPANYTDIQLLIEHINNSNIFRTHQWGNSTPLKEYVIFEFNRANQKTSIRLGPWFTSYRNNNNDDVVIIHLPEKLADMLGHRVYNPDGSRELKVYVGVQYSRYQFQGEPEFQKFPLERKYVRDTYQFNAPVFSYGVNNVIIYTDFVESSRLGDADASYILMVPVLAKTGEYVEYVPNNLIYRKVIKQQIDSIHIKVADTQGNRVKFNHGSGPFTCLIKFEKIGS